MKILHAVLLTCWLTTFALFSAATWTAPYTLAGHLLAQGLLVAGLVLAPLLVLLRRTEELEPGGLVTFSEAIAKAFDDLARVMR